MNKAFIGAGIALGLALAGCNYDLGNYPVGVPTLMVSFDEPNVSFSTTTNVLSGAYKVRANAIPGSPGGRLMSFITKGGASLPTGGLYVQACPIGKLGGKSCDPVISVQAIPFSLTGATVDDGVITDIVVMGENGISKTVPYSASLPIVAVP